MENPESIDERTKKTLSLTSVVQLIFEEDLDNIILKDVWLDLLNLAIFVEL
jgi:hypothetical protein